jgi:hypothetical protein
MTEKGREVEEKGGKEHYDINRHDVWRRLNDNKTSYLPPP